MESKKASAARRPCVSEPVSRAYKLAAPFPYFGGKRRIAAEVWRRFGAVRCYVEPFAGSLAVLLSVPRDTGRVETVNDANAYLCNFWRAVQAEPEAVAHWETLLS